MSTLDLAPVIRQFRTGTYAVTRRSPPTLTNGKATPGASVLVNVDGMLVPISGSELMRLSEGERTRERRLFLSESPLQLQGENGPSDVLSADGRSWEVERIEDWFALGGFYKATLIRVGD